MSFCEYTKKNYHLWITIFLIAIFSHGSMLLSNSIGIDTEDIITLKDLFYNGWLSVGRQGLVLLKLLTGTRVFNPYLAGVGTLFFTTAACLCWTYLFSYVSRRENFIAAFLFSMMFIVSPLITEQFYFKLQSMEVTIGFCLTAVSLLCVYNAATSLEMKKRYGLSVCAAVLNLVLFSLYQVMVPLFLFGAIACFFLYWFFRKDADTRFLARFTVTSAIVFLVSFAANQAITAIWFGTGMTYLTSQSAWFSMPFGECLMRIAGHAGRIALGRGMYYTKWYPVSCLLLAVLVCLAVKREKKGKMWIWGVLSMLAMMASPLCMTIICAGEPVIRSQLVMPFAVGLIAYVLVLIAERRKMLFYVVLFCCVVSGYIQLKDTIQLNYSDSVRYASDVRIATSIMDEMNKLEDEVHSYPVIFIGKHRAELNHSCIKGDLIGYSFFEWDTDVEPYSFFSTRRILGFMHTLGGNYVQGNEQQFKEAREYSKTMKNWPLQGSIELHNGCVIVKLSD